MTNQIAKKIFKTVVISIIFVIIGYLIAIFSSSYLHDSIKDIMLLEGIAVILITLFCITKPEPLNLNIAGSGIGDKTHATLEALKLEKGNKDYSKKFKDNDIVKLTFNSLTILLGGIFIILFSVFLA